MVRFIIDPDCPVLAGCILWTPVSEDLPLFRVHTAGLKDGMALVHKTDYPPRICEIFDGPDAADNLRQAEEMVARLNS